MSLILFALAATAQPLPFIDRTALHALARAEAARMSPDMRRARRLATLCRSLDPVGAAAPDDVARALSMAGPRVSIVSAACAVHRAGAPLQTAGLIR